MDSHLDPASSAASSLAHTLSASLSSISSAATASITPSAMDIATTVGASPERASTTWLSLVGHLIYILLHLVSSILYWAIKIVTMTIPALLFTIFSARWTVTMNATTLMLIVTALVGGVSWVVRYRILNMYSRLPPEPQRKEPDVDLFPDTHEGGAKSGLSNYLDEFLSAIKIFGYLERPVFHELTRSMQTKKLIAGETFNLEEEKGFCIVVDGLMEIFVKSGSNERTWHDRPDACVDSSSSDDDEYVSPGHQKYQLLTEVRNGAPMSSLFSIMSLFTEDVKLRTVDDEPSDSSSARDGMKHSHVPGSADFHIPGSVVSVPNTPQMSGPREASKQRTPNGSGEGSSGTPPHGTALTRIPPISLDMPVAAPSKPSHLLSPLGQRMPTTSAHPDIIARATVDTTIAIIPASAFRRLIKIYPKATAHIVHVILSRFQRVTLATAYNYLGLTSEVLRTEKHVIRYTMCQLPNLLRGDALARLKEKFNRERERIGEDERNKGIALHNAAAGRRRRSSTNLRKEAALHATAQSRPMSFGGSGTMPTSPGDPLATIQIARSGGQRSTDGPRGFSTSNGIDPLRRESSSPIDRPTFNGYHPSKPTRLAMDPRGTVDEDNLFRTSVLECMFSALGMDTTDSGSREAESAEGSPRFFSNDQRRSKPAFSNSNAFGFMAPLDSQVDNESESISSSVAMYSPPNAHALAHDMRDEVEIVFFPKGSVLVEQGERNRGLYYVIDGFLEICASGSDSTCGRTTQPGFAQPSSHTFGSPSLSSSRTFDFAQSPENGAGGSPTHRQSVALVKPGGLAGYISSVSSYRSFTDVVAKTDVYVGFLPRASLERIVDKYPVVLLTMAKRLTHLLPRLLLHIDFALEWVQVNAGQVIYHAEEESEAIYIVLNGRLRLVEEKKEGGVKVRAEFGQGESIGELEVLTESSRSGTLHAIRDTELVKFPRTLFNSLAQEHPNITLKISKIIASRMRSLVEESSGPVLHDGGSNTAFEKGYSTVNLRTVAILPVTAGVPVVEFGNRLMAALAQVGPPNGATSLNQSAILNHLGKHAFNKMGKLRLSQYLADLEEKYGLVVYVADTSVNSPWTQTCITQADSILVVGLAEGSPDIGEYERFMLGMKSTARKTLVLVHPERYSAPGLTRAWLKPRVWINGGHCHVQMTIRPNAIPVHPRTRRLGATIKERVQTIQAEIQKYTSRKVHHMPFYSPNTPYKGDFHRLARRLCGKAIGLVLGGGGARGIAQIGIIRAIEEAGIPVDVVGGTSIGAFIGALYARHADVVPIFGLAKKFAGRMGSMWRFALDLTYPSASYTTGHEFNRGIFKSFGDSQMEDFWLEYYCNTTNISKSRVEFHTSGYAWRYIRASMSLAGLLPPLCDEGSMLLDGGYVDNLTVSHMKWLGAEIIFAVDVGSIDDDTPQTFGDSLSGIWSIFNRWNPFSSHANPPTLAEIQARLAYVSSVDALERAKTMPGCIYMRPPIDGYGTLEFAKFDELYQLGYKYGQDFLQGLKDRGILPLVEETEEKKALRRTMAPRRASI